MPPIVQRRPGYSNAHHRVLVPDLGRVSFSPATVGPQLPLVVAEVLAGIVLGPSLLGWVWPEAMATLFPPSSMPALKMLSEVGLVLFMYLVGLEFDPRLLRGRTRASVVISHASIVVPFALGAAAAWWLWPRYTSPGVDFVPLRICRKWVVQARAWMVGQVASAPGATDRAVAALRRPRE